MVTGGMSRVAKHPRRPAPGRGNVDPEIHRKINVLELGGGAAGRHPRGTLGSGAGEPLSSSAVLRCEQSVSEPSRNTPCVRLCCPLLPTAFLSHSLILVPPNLLHKPCKTLALGMSYAISYGTKYGTNFHRLFRTVLNRVSMLC